MSALSAPRNTPEREGALFSDPVAAAVTCHAGALLVLDASGNAKPGVAATGLTARGRCEETVDNSAGSAGAQRVRSKAGVFRFANSASTDEITRAEIGDTCYIVDDQTVAKTDDAASRSAAGTVVDVDDAGVWVRVGLI